jgi:hypothetical protein
LLRTARGVRAWSSRLLRLVPTAHRNVRTPQNQLQVGMEHCYTVANQSAGEKHDRSVTLVSTTLRLIAHAPFLGPQCARMSDASWENAFGEERVSERTFWKRSACSGASRCEGRGCRPAGREPRVPCPAPLPLVTASAMRSMRCCFSTRGGRSPALKGRARQLERETGRDGSRDRSSRSC